MRNQLFRYKVELFANRERTCFDCFRLKNFTAIFTDFEDYYTLDGYTKLVVFKNKHILATIKSTISKEKIYG
jgi:hypothetical protein